MHEALQKQIIGPCRQKCGLSQEAPLAEVISALVDIGDCQKATELLFGISLSFANELLDTPSFQIFVILYEGRELELLKEMAGLYHWLGHSEEGCYSIEIFPHDYLVIDASMVSPNLRSLLEPVYIRKQVRLAAPNLLAYS